MAVNDWPPYMWPAPVTSAGPYWGNYGGWAPPAFQLGGWSCPGCLRCFSPALTECPYCPAQKPAGEGAFGALSPILPVQVDDPPGRRPEPRPFRYHFGTACPKPTEGGLCGCGEVGDAPAGPCTSVNCSC